MSQIQTINKENLSGRGLILFIFEKYKPRKVGIAFSGDLDSLATALLVLDTLPTEVKKYIVFNNTTNEIPESLKYTRRMLKWFEDNYDNVVPVEIRPKITWAKLMEKMFQVAVEMYESGIWRKGRLRCCYYLKEKPTKDFYRKMNIRVYFTGLRAEESVQRRLFMAQTHGVWKKEFIHVMPIWNWTKQDVLRYIHRHPLNPPINPIYEMGFDGTGCMLCPVKFLWARKSLRALKKHYPNAYRLGFNLIKKYSKQRRF